MDHRYHHPQSSQSSPSSSSSVAAAHQHHHQQQSNQQQHHQQHHQHLGGVGLGGGGGGGGGNGGGTLIGVGVGSSHSSSSSSTSFLRYDETQQNSSNDYTDFDDEDDYSENDDDSDELPDSDNTLLNGLHFSFAGKRLQPNLCMYLIRVDCYRDPPPKSTNSHNTRTYTHSPTHTTVPTFCVIVYVFSKKVLLLAIQYLQVDEIPPSA